MAEHTTAGKMRQSVIEEFEEAGFTIDARELEPGTIGIKPHVEPGTETYDEFISFLKKHEAVTPRDDAGGSNFIFEYDADSIEVK